MGPSPRTVKFRGVPLTALALWQPCLAGRSSEHNVYGVHHSITMIPPAQPSTSQPQNIHSPLIAPFGPILDMGITWG